MEPFIPCELCATTGTPGYTFVGGESTFCNCRVAYEKERYFRLNATLLGIPENNLSYDINSYLEKNPPSPVPMVKRLLEECSDVLKSFVVYFSGETNTQKTSVASWFVRESYRRNRSSFYTTMPSLLKALIQRDNFNKDEDTYKSSYFIDKMLKMKTLCIDDSFDLSRLYFSGKSGFKSVLISNFLLERFYNPVVTLIVSKNSISRIPKQSKTNEGFDPEIEFLLKRNHVELEFNDKLTPAEMRSDFLKRL